MMEEQHAPSHSFEAFLPASFFPYVICFFLLCLAIGSCWLDSSNNCEHVRVSTTTSKARPKERPQLSTGKREISALKVDPVRDSNDDDDDYDEDGDDDDEEDYDDDEEGDDNDDDDEDDGWEVLERRQLRREYARAVRFVESQKNEEGMLKLSDDEKLRLYGLHKVAVEGPCQEPQPSPFNLAGRAKWNAWRRLGFMSPDDAVEQYIDLLQEKFPNWRKDLLVVRTAGDQDRDPKRHRIIVEARISIGSICSLLSFFKYSRLAMNKH